MIPRPYQERIVELARAEYRAGRRAVLAQSPVGSGKTVIAAVIARAAIERGRRVLFGAHRIELLNQAVAKLAAAGITDVRVIRADRDEGRLDAPMVVASIPTLATPRWIDRLPEADLVMLDEAHRAACESWGSIARAYFRARLLGFSATPCRGDGVGLREVFDALVRGPTVRELTALGHLVPLRTFYPRSELPLASGKIAMTPLEAYRRFAAGRRAIVFATRVEDAKAHAAELTAGGVPAACVSSEMGDDERAAALARLASGELRALTNVDILTEGTDIPPADAAILACLPGHVGRLIQMAGRVLRPSPVTGKRDAVLVDLRGSVLIHGTPDMDRTYSLGGRGISGPARAAIRQCGECGGVFEAGPRACPMCGRAAPASERGAPRSIGIGLEEAVDLPARRAGILRRNLGELARMHGFDEAWIERAARAIGAAELPWVAGARARRGAA